MVCWFDIEYPSRNAAEPHMYQLYHFTSLGIPCDENGYTLPPGSLPPTQHPANVALSNPWNPFNGWLTFEFTNYHFTKLQSSAAQINLALKHWLVTMLLAGGSAYSVPWRNAQGMYVTIDSIKEGPVQWRTVKFQYTGPLPPGMALKWMLESNKLCFHDPHAILLNQITLSDLQDHFNFTPYMHFNHKKDCVWSNLMSGSWAWEEVVSTKMLSFFQFILLILC